MLHINTSVLQDSDLSLINQRKTEKNWKTSANICSFFSKTRTVIKTGYSRGVKSLQWFLLAYLVKSSLSESLQPVTQLLTLQNSSVNIAWSCKTVSSIKIPFLFVCFTQRWFPVYDPFCLRVKDSILVLSGWLGWNKEGLFTGIKTEKRKKQREKKTY